MDLILVLKTVLATTSAWWICVNLLDSQMPFLAPWVAFLALQPTVTSSLTSGVQTILASGIGVILSSAVGLYLGVTIWSYALAIFLGLVGSRIPGIRKEGATIATTAVFLLSTGFTEDTPALIDRMIEITIGVTIGVGFNFIIVPPLRDNRRQMLSRPCACVLQKFWKRSAKSSQNRGRANKLMSTLMMYAKCVEI